jgi:hypothetical protein
VNTQTSASHCGSCGTSCANTGDDFCSSGLCYNSTRDCGECYTRPSLNGTCYSSRAGGNDRSVRIDYDATSGSYRMAFYGTLTCSGALRPQPSCSIGAFAPPGTDLINRGSGCCTTGTTGISWTPGANCYSLTMYEGSGGTCPGGGPKAFLEANPAPFKVPNPEC